MLNQKNRTSILEYKFLYEQQKQIDEEVSLGIADLTSALQFFKKRVLGQDKKYDEFFFGQSDKKNNLVALSEHAVDNNKDAPTKKIKSLYKKIVGVTHPDRTDKIVSKHLVDILTSQYMLCVDSFRQGNYQNIIMVGSDLKLPVDNEMVKTFVLPALEKITTDISEKKKLLAYQWYHTPEQKKENFLSMYLQSLGFVVKENEIKNAIKNRKGKRKRGQRPINYRKLK